LTQLADQSRNFRAFHPETRLALNVPLSEDIREVCLTQFANHKFDLLMGDGMSEQKRQTETREQTKQSPQGLFKHIRGAALAAALVPLVSVAVTPALAQTSTCITGFVWFDANDNGIQDPGEGGIEGAVVTITTGEGVDMTMETGPTGEFVFCGLIDNSDYPITVIVPPGFTPSPANQGTSEALDSDGICCISTEGQPDQVSTTAVVIGPHSTTDFGFWKESEEEPPPGTGTPGYWKNHPEAWPVTSITIGVTTYTVSQAIALLSEGGSDKSITMFSSLLSAMLNVFVGNESSCVDGTIAAANAWMAAYGPAGSGVKASGAAWKVGEPLHRTMDNYNNGMLCAPHRD
jgi:hypothetical protein